MGAALGFVALRDMLHHIVTFPALALPGRFVWPYLNVPRLPYDALGEKLLLGLQGVALLGCCMLLGLRFARVGALLVVGVYAYGFVADRLMYTNNVYALMVMLVITATGLGPNPWRAALSRRAGQLFITSIYVTAALSKLSPAWLSGDILHGAMLTYAPVWRMWVGDLPRWVTLPGAWLTVLLEVGLALGLWWPKSRRMAMALGTLFHVAIEVVMPVRMFSYVMVSGYLLFLDRADVERLERVYASIPWWARLVGALAVALGINGVFSRFVGYYTSRFVLWPSVLGAFSIFALLTLFASGRRTEPTPRARPMLRAWPLLLLLGAGQAALLIKPVFGATTDFSFRLFTGLLAVRVERWELRGADWQPRPLDGLTHLLDPTEPRWRWWSWSDERAMLQAYLRHAARTSSADRVKLIVETSLDGLPPRVETWESPTR